MAQNQWRYWFYIRQMPPVNDSVKEINNEAAGLCPLPPAYTLKILEIKKRSKMLGAIIQQDKESSRWPQTQHSTHVNMR